MDLPDIISSGIVTIFESVIIWIAQKGEDKKILKKDIQKAYSNFKEEIKQNCFILEKIKLEEIVTKDITNPSVKGIASRLQTKAASELLESIYSLIQEPEKAVKALKNKTLSKEEKTEAVKLVKTIISLHDNIKELQFLTTLTNDERKILKGFYARARIKTIQQKSFFIRQQIMREKR